MIECLKRVRRPRGSRALVLSPIVFALCCSPFAGGCSLLLESDAKQCVTDDDCVAGDGSGGLQCQQGLCLPQSVSSCIGESLPLKEGDVVAAKMFIWDLWALSEVGGSVFVCDRTDFLDGVCSQKFYENTNVDPLTGMDISFERQRDGQRFVMVVESTTGDPTRPTIADFDELVEEYNRRPEGDDRNWVPVLQDQLLLTLGSSLGRPANLEGRAQIFAFAYDCNMDTFVGATLQLFGAGGIPYYLRGDIPQTAAIGFAEGSPGGFHNVDIEDIDITGNGVLLDVRVSNPEGDVVGSLDPLVRTGWTTVRTFMPHLQSPPEN